MDWQELTNVTRGQRFVVERVRLASGVAIEGVFEVPALAQLSAEEPPQHSQSDVIERLHRGDISAAEAIAELEGQP